MTETINDNQRRSVKIIGIPMQFFPSQDYPGLQVQLWDPWVLCNILHSHHRYGFCFRIHLYLMTGTRKHNNSIGMLHTNCNAFLSISRVSRFAGAVVRPLSVATNRIQITGMDFVSAFIYHYQKSATFCAREVFGTRFQIIKMAAWRSVLHVSLTYNVLRHTRPHMSKL